MGYELHVIREGSPITQEECRQLGSFEASQLCLQFEGIDLRLENGQIAFKNPSPDQLEILFQLARRLEAPSPSPPSARRSWWKSLWPSKKAPPADCPFQPGVRVRCIIRQQEAVVVSVEGGILAKVTIRFPDGSTHVRAVDAAGLEILSPIKDPLA